MAQMRVGINYPKGGKDFNDHGRVTFDKPVEGVANKTTNFSVPSTRNSFVGIKDADTVKLWQDSLLYHTIHPSRPTEKWRQQDWRDASGSVIFTFKNTLFPTSNRSSQISTDSIAHNTVIKTEGSLGKIKFFDPFFVDGSTLTNRNTFLDTIPRAAPFLPQTPPGGSDIGADSAHYGGIFLAQDEFRAALTPNYSLNAFSVITSDSLKGKDTLANTGDWVFLHWYLNDDISGSDPTPPELLPYRFNEDGFIVYAEDGHMSFNKQYDPIFMKDSADYIARYKRHMMTYDDTLGFAFNGQRKLAYSFNDSLGNNHYNIVYASSNRIFTTSGYKMGNYQSILANSAKWNNEILISGWSHVAWGDTLGYGYDYGFPALGLHRPWTNPISHIVYEALDRSSGDRYVILTQDSTNKQPSYTADLNILDKYIPLNSKLTMPVIAPGDNPIGTLDVVAYVADTGIVVEAISNLGRFTGTTLTSELRTDKLHHELLRFGNITANHPTIWMDSCKTCSGTSSVHHVWLAWQQDTTITFSFRPHRTGPNPGGPLGLPIDLPVTDIFCVEFDVQIGPSNISFTNVGTPTDVSFTTQNFSYDNRNPCISGARYFTGGTDSSLVRIAYESWADFGGPYQGITVAHQRTGSGWKTTAVFATSDTITNLYHNPSIEVTTFHRSIPVPNYYSLAFDCGNHKLYNIGQWTRQRIG
jgi:hypothetical protein